MDNIFFSFEFLIAEAAFELIAAGIRCPWLIDAAGIRSENNA